MVPGPRGSTLFPYTTLFRSLRIRDDCSCAKSRPPSSVPTSPSALSGPCHAIVHAPPPLTTPGIGAVVTARGAAGCPNCRSEEHTSELQSQSNLVCRLLLEKK